MWAGMRCIWQIWEGTYEDNSSQEEGKPGKLLTLFIATASPHRTQVDQSCPEKGEQKFQC